MPIRRFFSAEISVSDALKQLKQNSRNSDDTRKKIVVLGTGWASVGFLGDINRAMYDILVISPRPHFTFNPLLPSVVGGAISEESARTTMSVILGKGIKYKQDLAESIDVQNKKVMTSNGDSVSYDYLVYAIGTTNNTFGIPGVQEHSFFLKEWEDATVFRNHITATLNDAKKNMNNRPAEELRTMLHFAIVGAGPTGTEVAAEMIDLIKSTYADLVPFTKITLIDMMNRVLPMYSEKTSQIALQNLKNSGLVEVLLNCAMTKRTDKSISLKSKGALPDSLLHLVTSAAPLNGGGSEFTLHTPTVLWASGVTQRPMTQDLISKQIEGTDLRRPPGLLVDEALRAHKFDNIFVMGDNGVCSPTKLADRSQEIITFAKSKEFHDLESAFNELGDLFPQLNNNSISGSTPLVDEKAVHERLMKLDEAFRSPPPTAQNANQQGQYLARVFNSHGPEKSVLPAFVYNNRGSMCYIGEDRAIIELDKDYQRGIYGSRGSGLLWRTFYSLKQVSVGKKLSVLTDFANKWCQRKLRIA